MTDVDDLINTGRPIKDKPCVVPWYNREEFLKVYRCLYSNELTQMRWAVDQIAVWDSRWHPSLPTAIEASLVLARAIIQDILFMHDSTLCHEGEIQMLYSMALVRFVNLSIELHQGSEKQQIAHIAQGLGIPSWVVDLRNEATHSITPSLSVLRMGVGTAMKYLSETFWNFEYTRMRNIVKKPDDIQRMRELILHYQVIQFKLFRHKRKHSELLRSDKEEIVITLRKMIQCLNKKKEKFLSVLIMDGFFITAEEDLKFLLTDKELSEFYGPLYCKDSDIEDENKILSCPVLPTTLEVFWQPLLRKINIFGAIPEFVEALLSTLRQRDATGQRLIASWVIKILRLSMNPHLRKNTLAEMFKRKCPLFNWDRLMYAAVSNLCIYTPIFFPLIASHLDLEKEFVRSIMNLMAIAQGQAIIQNVRYPINKRAFTLDKLRQALKVQDQKLQWKKKMDEKEKEEEKEKKEETVKKEEKVKKEEEEEINNLWSPTPDNVDFSNFPMGYIFNSSDEEEGPMIERVYPMFYANEVKYTWTIGPNKNDTEDMEGVVTVEEEEEEEEEMEEEEEDEHILKEKDAYLYRKRT